MEVSRETFEIYEKILNRFRVKDDDKKNWRELEEYQENMLS